MCEILYRLQQVQCGATTGELQRQDTAPQNLRPVTAHTGRHMHAQQCGYLQLIWILKSAIVILFLMTPAHVRCGEPAGRRLHDYVSRSIGACHRIERLSLL